MRLNKIKSVCAAALLLGVGVGYSVSSLAVPSQDAWIGTWKLDPAKSKLTGDTMTYSKLESGMYRFSDGGPVTYDFGIDGKTYPAAYGRSTTWTAVGDHAWDSVSTRSGAPTYKVHREVSADEKTLTVTTTGTKPDGTAMNDTDVYQRVSGSSGLVGKWKNVKSTSAGPSTFVVTSPSPGVMHFEIPDYQQTVEGKMDGTDLPMKGASAPAGTTFGGKFEAGGKLSYVMKFNGKPDTYGVQTMAADGKTYTDVSWTAGKPDEKMTAVYVKQ